MEAKIASPSRPKKNSLAVIAQEAGVSASTVSRVINKMPGVNSEVVRQVQDVMTRMGYQPPARRPGPKPASRKGLKTGNILLLAVGVNTAELYRLPVFPDLIHGIEASVKESGLNLVLATLEPDGFLPAALTSRDIDGTLLLGDADTLTPQARTILQDAACVGLLRGYDEIGTRIDRVVYDNLAVGRLAAEYLLERRHRCVAAINVYAKHAAFATRIKAFGEYASANNAQVVTAAGDATGFWPTPEQFGAVIDQLYSNSTNPPTGLFVASDAQLPEVYRALRSRGLTLPKDVEIISCDNQEEFLRQLAPRPATIDLGLRMIGRSGVRQLLWRLRNPGERNRITMVVEPVLVPPTDQ